MLHLILLIFYIILLILVSAGFLFIEFHKNIDESTGENYEPETLVMVPCRGLDYSLENNLKSIKNQNYHKYRMVCIVDNKEDPALDIIKNSRSIIFYPITSAKNAAGR